MQMIWLQCRVAIYHALDEGKMPKLFAGEVDAAQGQLGSRHAWTRHWDRRDLDGEQIQVDLRQIVDAG